MGFGATIPRMFFWWQAASERWGHVCCVLGPDTVGRGSQQGLRRKWQVGGRLTCSTNICFCSVLSKIRKV